MNFEFQSVDWHKDNNPEFCEELHIRAAIPSSIEYVSSTGGDGTLTVEFDRNGTIYFQIQLASEEDLTSLESPAGVLIAENTPFEIPVSGMVEGSEYKFFWFFTEEFQLFRTPQIGLENFVFTA